MTRKRSNISYYTRTSKKTRLRRAQETDEERSERLKINRERRRMCRLVETEAEREARLLADRERVRKRRRRILSEELEAIRAAHREHKRRSRLNETEEEREARLKAQRIWAANSRARESNKRWNASLLVDQQRKAQACGLKRQAGSTGCNKYVDDLTGSDIKASGRAPKANADLAETHPPPLLNTSASTIEKQVKQEPNRDDNQPEVEEYVNYFDDLPNVTLKVEEETLLG